jgi:hypothetical protein
MEPPDDQTNYASGEFGDDGAVPRELSANGVDSHSESADPPPIASEPSQPSSGDSPPVGPLSPSDPSEPPLPASDDAAAEVTSEEPNDGDESGMEVRDRPPRIAPVRSSSSVISLSHLSPLVLSPTHEAENRRLYTNYVGRARLPPREARPQLLQHIQRLKVNALVAQKFDAAAKHQSMLLHFQEAVSEQDAKERRAQRRDELDEQLRDVERRLSALEKESARLVVETAAAQRERRQAIVKRHEEELDVFADRWNDPEYLRKFAKPSGYLLQIKKTERSMVLTKLFDQAAVFHRKVRALEKEESDLAQSRAEAEMAKDREKILEKQRQELANFDFHSARQIEQIRQAQDIKRSAYEARQAKLASEVEEWKTNTSTTMPLGGAAIIPKAAMTPRTAKRYAAFKKVVKPPIITVRPLGKVRPVSRKRPKTADTM